jgi:hypothetical protein
VMVEAETEAEAQHHAGVLVELVRTALT